MKKTCAYRLIDTSASAWSWSALNAVNRGAPFKRTSGAKMFSRLAPRMATIASLKTDASKGHAINELGGDEAPPFSLPDLVNGQNVRMIGRACRACLAFETAHPFGVVCELRGQQLERDLAMQPFVFGQIDLAHTASAQQ